MQTETRALTDLDTLHVPPHPRATVEILRTRGHHVAVRRNRYGSWRYIVDGSREMTALQMSRKYAI